MQAPKRRRTLASLSNLVDPLPLPRLGGSAGRTCTYFGKPSATAEDEARRFADLSADAASAAVAARRRMRDAARRKAAAGVEDAARLRGLLSGTSLGELLDDDGLECD